MKVIKQNWEESERGWGVRPDGYSLHLNEEDRIKYIQEYWDKQPSKVPDIYERPFGAAVEVEVNYEEYQKLIYYRNNYGIRCYE